MNRLTLGLVLLAIAATAGLWLQPLGVGVGGASVVAFLLGLPAGVLLVEWAVYMWG